MALKFNQVILRTLAELKPGTSCIVQVLNETNPGPSYQVTRGRLVYFASLLSTICGPASPQIFLLLPYLYLPFALHHCHPTAFVFRCSISSWPYIHASFPGLHSCYLCLPSCTASLCRYHLQKTTSEHLYLECTHSSSVPKSNMCLESRLPVFFYQYVLLGGKEPQNSSGKTWLCQPCEFYWQCPLEETKGAN